MKCLRISTLVHTFVMLIIHANMAAPLSRKSGSYPNPNRPVWSTVAILYLVVIWHHLDCLGHPCTKIGINTNPNIFRIRTILDSGTGVEGKKEKY